MHGSASSTPRLPCREPTSSLPCPPPLTPQVMGLQLGNYVDLGSNVKAALAEGAWPSIFIAASQEKLVAQVRGAGVKHARACTSAPRPCLLAAQSAGHVGFLASPPPALRGCQEAGGLGAERVPR